MLVLVNQTKAGWISPPHRRRLCPVTSVARQVAPNLVRVSQLGGAVLWLIPWLALGVVGKVRRRILTVDEFGNVVEQKI